MLRGSLSSPASAAHGPGSVISPAAGDGAGHFLARCGISGRIESGHGRLAIRAAQAQTPSAAHRALIAQGEREFLLKRINSRPLQRHKENRMRFAQKILFLRGVRQIQRSVNRTLQHQLRNAAKGPIPSMQRMTVRIIKGGPSQHAATCYGSVRKAWRVLAAEFHARKISSHLCGHQQSFPCQHVATKAFAEKSTASGSHHNGISLHFP
ncbi:hypothetical protein D3C75_566930 [compost metagenome]